MKLISKVNLYVKAFGFSTKKNLLLCQRHSLICEKLFGIQATTKTLG